MSAPGTFHTRADHAADAEFRIGDDVIGLRHAFVDLARHVVEVFARAAYDEHFGDGLCAATVEMRVS